MKAWCFERFVASSLCNALIESRDYFEWFSVAHKLETCTWFVRIEPRGRLSLRVAPGYLLRQLLWFQLRNCCVLFSVKNFDIPLLGITFNETSCADVDSVFLQKPLMVRYFFLTARARTFQNRRSRIHVTELLWLRFRTFSTWISQIYVTLTFNEYTYILWYFMESL